MKMKKLIILPIALLLSVASLGQNKKYKEAMKKQIVLLDSAKKTEQFVKVGAGFERLAKIEKSDWLPQYYAAAAYVYAAFETEGEAIDKYCDKADLIIDRADSLSKNNCEIQVLKAMSAVARIKVDPMARGWQFGKISYDCTNEAMKLDPENPRTYYNKGQMLFYTPESFGGGTTKAKPFLEKAVEKYKTFKPASDIHPNWGKAEANRLLIECKKED